MDSVIGVVALRERVPTMSEVVSDSFARGRVEVIAILDRIFQAYFHSLKFVQKCAHFFCLGWCSELGAHGVRRSDQFDRDRRPASSLPQP